MDRIIFYLTIFSICGLIVIGGNYFLTDDVGNFSMEKAKNLVPNIAEAFVEKTNAITGTRDINKDMTAKKAAERLDIEGPASTIEHLVTKPWGQSKEISDVSTQYYEELSVLQLDELTTLQQKRALIKFHKKYEIKRFNWSGTVTDVKGYINSYIITMIPKNWEYETLFCDMVKNDFNLSEITKIKKKDIITVTGDYKSEIGDPWLHNCEIVDQ